MNWKTTLPMTLVLCGGILIGIYCAHYFIELKWKNFAPFHYTKNTYPVQLEQIIDFTKGAEIALQSSVSIKAWKTNQSESTGAGVIFNAQGYIVTNYHVIKSSKLIEIELFNHVKLSAELIGYDEYTDLAVIKVRTDIPLKPITFANSDNLRIGQWVMAIGCPYHLHATVTKGIISGLGRDIGVLKNNLENQEFSDLVIESFIQTDAPINPGNSGGALVNLNGEMVGINTAIASETGLFEGFSFAIPSNLVLKVVKDIMNYGKVNRSFLGISAQITKNPFFYKKLNTFGLEIYSVSINSPAFRAGLMEGDIILSINKIKIQNVPDLKQKIASYSPNETLDLQVFRNDQFINIKVKLEALNEYLNQGL